MKMGNRIAKAQMLKRTDCTRNFVWGLSEATNSKGIPNKKVSSKLAMERVTKKDSEKSVGSFRPSQLWYVAKAKAVILTVAMGAKNQISFPLESLQEPTDSTDLPY